MISWSCGASPSTLGLKKPGLTEQAKPDQPETKLVGFENVFDQEFMGTQMIRQMGKPTPELMQKHIPFQAQFCVIVSVDFAVLAST